MEYYRVAKKKHLETLASARERAKFRKRWPRRPTPSSLWSNEVFLKHSVLGNVRWISLSRAANRLLGL